MFTSCRRLLPRYRGYLRVAAVLFSLGLVLGALAVVYYPDTIRETFQAVEKELGRLGDDILNSSVGQGSLLLFRHNLQTVLLVVALGFVLGLYPVFSMLFNGLIIGVVGMLSVQSGSLLVFLGGILPHGIFEIPALLLGAAIGMRFGIGPLVGRRGNQSSANAWQGYGQEIKNSLLPLGLTVALLGIAAVIEVGITPLIIQALL